MITALFEDEDYKNFLPITTPDPFLNAEEAGVRKGRFKL